MPAYALFVLLLSVALIGVRQPSAFASYAFPNSQVVAEAESYPIGYDGGQCKVWAGNVINAVLAANGISARVGGYGSPGGAYYGAYANAGGTLISASQAQPGDLVQFIAAAQENSDYPTGTLHTAIIVGMTSTPGTYVLRDSNWSWDGKVQQHNLSPVSWAAAHGVSAYFWRFGTVSSPPGSSIAVASDKDGRLELFGTNAAGNVWHRWQLSPNGSWSGWHEFDGALTQVAAGTNADGRLELFGVNSAGQVWHRWQTSPGGSWFPWKQFDGSLRA